jgi:hypothetical protein
MAVMSIIVLAEQRDPLDASQMQTILETEGVTRRRIPEDTLHWH